MSPPLNGCVLCYRTYLHLKNDFWREKKNIPEETEVPHVVIHRQLTWQVADGKIQVGNLEGTIDDQDYDSYLLHLIRTDKHIDARKY